MALSLIETTGRPKAHWVALTAAVLRRGWCLTEGPFVGGPAPAAGRHTGNGGEGRPRRGPAVRPPHRGQAGDRGSGRAAGHPPGLRPCVFRTTLRNPSQTRNRR